MFPALLREGFCWDVGRMSPSLAVCRHHAVKGFTVRMRPILMHGVQNLGSSRRNEVADGSGKPHVLQFMGQHLFRADS